MNNHSVTFYKMPLISYYHLFLFKQQPHPECHMLHNKMWLIFMLH